MSLTATAPIVTEAILAAVNAADGAPKAFETWPGTAEAEAEMLVLGATDWDGYEIATIKAGRKQRQENYSIAFELFAFGAEDTTPAEPGPARARAYELFSVIENLLADDVTAGMDGVTVQHIQIRPLEAEARVLPPGWAYRIKGEFVVAARLL